MQTRNRILDDLARIAGGAAGTFTGIKEEIEALVRQRIERLLGNLDLVGREEFEVVRDMAAKARAEQEKLEARVALLEARLKGAKSAPRPRKTTAEAEKSAPKKAAPDKKAKT